MFLYSINHSFHYELENLTRAFFPNDKITSISQTAIPEVSADDTVITASSDDKLFVSIRFSEYYRELYAEHSDDDELTLASLLYRLLCEYTGIRLSWGLLTGVRPIKLFRKLCTEQGTARTKSYFKDKLLVTDDKLSLAEITCCNEQRILDLSQSNSFSLYVSIPFCPTRCSYCSFVSQSVEKAKHLIRPYVELLCEEIKQTAEYSRLLGLRLESVYIGGGTPTTLEASELRRIMSVINESFDMSMCREFTVEAGRPDTITEDKLIALYECGCDRLSVNPQTLNDEVLRNIGRKHTVDDFYKAYELADRIGFKCINTDLIAGLPLDTPESFHRTMEGILRLSPENVTVHTLSMKRSSYLTGNNLKVMREDSLAVSWMLSDAYDLLCDSGYIPYYLYRQSKMVGNMENTGWSKKSFEGLYNVYIMDETHTILACGAGAVTKLKDPGFNNIERIFNFKYPYEYNARFSELIERKKGIETFYNNIRKSR